MSPLSPSCAVVAKAVQVISLGESPRAVELGTVPGAKALVEALRTAAEPPVVKAAPPAPAPVMQVEHAEKVPEKVDSQRPTSFSCKVDKAGKPLGIRVEYVSDKCIVVALTQGAIPSWNTSNSDGQEIRTGDCIVQVDGKGGSASQLAERLAQVQGQVELQIQRPGQVSIACKADQKLGVKVLELQDGFGLEVSEVKEEGQIPAFNKENASVVKNGDRIVAVNGTQSDSKQLFDSVSNAGDKELVIFTYA